MKRQGFYHGVHGDGGVRIDDFKEEKGFGFINNSVLSVTSVVKFFEVLYV